MELIVLASGSKGNATLLVNHGFGLLVDVGLGPRQLAARLAARNHRWTSVHAVLLTHTHGDHWNERTLKYLVRVRIPVYCHREHARALRTWSAAFRNLELLRLVRFYEAGERFKLPAQLDCLPLELAHDGGPTFGFRFDLAPGLFEPATSIGYLADLGCWTAELAAALAGVQVLALEFNHDVNMQWSSGRSTQLIERVLGDQGHLSNEQAGQLLDHVLTLAPDGTLRHVVQLHLSLECNRPELAAATAQQIFARRSAQCVLVTAEQHQPAEAVVC